MLSIGDTRLLRIIMVLMMLQSLLAGTTTKRVTRLLQGLVVLLGLGYAGTYFGRLHPFLDNLSNFPVHFAAAFLGLAAALAACRSRPWALASAAAAALALAPVAPWYFATAASADDATQPSKKLLISNVYVANHQHKRLLQRIAEENPDVIGLVEVNSRWLHRLKALRAAYPYHFEVPDEHYVGLALYSRLPLEDARVLQLGVSSTPAIAATLKTATGDVEFILAHPISPLNAEYIQRRNQQILALAQYVAAANQSTVLAGDLNLTIWNRGYRPLAETGGLHNAREGHGVEPTWPSIGPLGVPIDHILATPDVQLSNFQVLGDIGSDHLPIAAEFSLR